MGMTVTTWEINLTTTYGSDPDFYQYFTKDKILQILTVIMALVGLTGNAVVLWLLSFHMPRNIFSVYILNLAGADFLFLCCLVVHILDSIFNLHFVSGVISGFLTLVSMFAYISGLNILGTISTERCMSVLWPIWYRCHRPTHMSAIMCALLWVLSLLLSMMEGYFCSILSVNVHYVLCYVLAVITMAWLVLLFVLLSGSSLALMTRLLCCSQRVLPTRLYVTVVLTVLVFLLCGLPYGIHGLLISWDPNEPYDYFKLSKTVVLLSCVNSCANPIIYFFVGSFRQRWQKQRHTLRLVLQRALQDTPEVDEPGESLPGEALEMSGTSQGQ